MPTDYPLLITLGVVLTLNPLLKSLMLRSGIPPLVAYIGFGFLINLLNQQWDFLNHSADSVFAFLAQLGVVALLFRVGLKSHTRALLAKLPQASVIWLGDVLFSLLFGFVVAFYGLSLSLETSLVIATAFSATSVAVSVVVWDEMKQLNTSTGQLLVDVAELDDLSGVLLLAILIAVLPVLQTGNGDILPLVGNTTLFVLLKLALFITGCYLFAQYIEPIFTHFNRQWERSTTGLTISVLGTGLAIAAIAGYLGFSLAIGALFAGLAFSRDPEAVRTDTRYINFYEFLTPFFFIYIGMQIEPNAVAASLGIAAVMFVPVALGKFMGVAIPALRIVNRFDATLLGLSMIPRAEITMVVVYQCRQLGSDIVSAEIFSAMVIVSVLTSIMAPVLLRTLLNKESG